MNKTASCHKRDERERGQGDARGWAFPTAFVVYVLGVSQSTVAGMWRLFQTHKNVSHMHGGGRERVTTQCEDLFFFFVDQA